MQYQIWKKILSCFTIIPIERFEVDLEFDVSCFQIYSGRFAGQLADISSSAANQRISGMPLSKFRRIGDLKFVKEIKNIDT